MKTNIIKYVVLLASLIAETPRINADIERGWDYFKNQEYARAALEFENVLQTQPDAAAIWEGLGWCRYRLGQYEDAEAAFMKALELDPQSTGAVSGLAEVKKWRYMIFNNAWLLFNNKDYETALNLFKSILEDTSGRLPAAEMWKVHSGIGWCQYYLQNYAAAEKSFRNILTVYKNNAYAQKGLGYTLYQLGKYEDAYTALDQAAKAHPEWADVTSMMGWCRYSLKEYNAALNLFKKAADANGLLADPRYGTGWTYHQLGDDDRALDAFRKAVGLSPYHPGNYALFNLIDKNRSWWPLYRDFGWSYYRQGDYTSASKVFNDALERISDDYDLLRGAAFCRFRTGDYNGASEQLEKIVRAGVDLPVVTEIGFAPDGSEFTIRSDAASILAWCYYYQGKYKKALSLFRQEVSRHPDWADLHAGLGWCTLKLDDPDEAETHFEASLKINPYYSVALSGKNEVKKLRYAALNAAWNSYYAGDYTAAADRFKAVIDGGLDRIDETDRWQAYSGLGWASYHLGRFDDAGEAFRTILRLDENNYYGHAGLAKVAAARDDWDLAEKHVDAALKLDDSALDLWELKGWILYHRKRYGEALKVFNTVIARSNQRGSAYTGAGWCLLAKKDPAGAEKMLRKALELSPDDAKAAEGLAKLSENRKTAAPKTNVSSKPTTSMNASGGRRHGNGGSGGSGHGRGR